MSNSLNSSEKRRPRQLLKVLADCSEEGALPNWADVYIADTDDRCDLQSKALFTIPSARQILSDANITVNVLSARSTNLRLSGNTGKSRIAGRSALTKVVACEPVVYESATGFVRLANEALKAADSNESFDTNSIVACVFALHDFAELASRLSQTAESLATACEIPVEIVKSAFEHYRLHYVHAEKLWRHCLSINQSNLKRPDWLTSDPTSLIKTKVPPTGRAGIKRLDGSYVYQRSDLYPAPLTGHPWAIA
jgi:hypothetical protein